MHPIQKLYEVVDELLHVRAEHGRDPPNTGLRRKQENRLEALETSFDKLVERWVDDDRERQQWRDYLAHRGDAPDRRIHAEPPLFKGMAEDGGTAEVRVHGPGVEISIDGAPIGDAARYTGHAVSKGDVVYREITDVPDASLEALREQVEDPRGDPPWEHARALYEDGLIDENFSLTVRGKRVLGMTH